MSGKLDQSLDEIATAQRRTSTRRRGAPRRSSGRPAAAAPVGGIQKNTKPARGAANKAAPAKAIATTGDSKVIVSNLPRDVTEKQIKEYFVQSVGPIRRVELVYGPNSQSRGIANVTFNKPDGASIALQKLNGLLVDGRPIKIEVVVGAAQAKAVIPQAKSLAERTTQPKAQAKAQPKSAATDKQNNTAGKGAAKGGRGNKRQARNPRPAKKTEAELDLDMADYFGAAPNENAAAAAPAAATADAPMEDEIM
jgi:THO complex subunit 4